MNFCLGAYTVFQSALVGATLNRLHQHTTIHALHMIVQIYVYV